MRTWPSSQWSAGIFYIRAIRVSPDLAVFAGSIRARKPAGDNKVKGRASPDMLAMAGAGGPLVEGDYDDYGEGYGVMAAASTTSGGQVARALRLAPRPRSTTSTTTSRFKFT